MLFDFTFSRQTGQMETAVRTDKSTSGSGAEVLPLSRTVFSVVDKELLEAAAVIDEEVREVTVVEKEEEGSRTVVEVRGATVVDKEDADEHRPCLS